MGRGDGPMRLIHTFFDTEFTGWLPIFCYVVEHPEGLIVVDTGISADINAPVYFPPYMRFVLRAAQFDIGPEREIGPQMRRKGLSPQDVRWVVLTHLHPDHDGGLRHFPNAEFVVSRTEWRHARGIWGRLAGYMNHHWPSNFDPTPVDFDDSPVQPFGQSHALTKSGDVRLVPTPGHTAGHLSVVVEEDDHRLFFAGDAAYSQELLVRDMPDGIGLDVDAQHETHERILLMAANDPIVFLPSHDWDARTRLERRDVISEDMTAARPNESLYPGYEVDESDVRSRPDEIPERQPPL